MTQRVTGRPGRSRPGVGVAAGALLGLAWAAGLRAYMAELSGASSTVDWAGTFGAVLFPATVTGAMFGWADHLRRGADAPYRPWLAAAPLTLAVGPLLLPGAVPRMLATGVGTGAWWLVITGILGGYAVSGRGPVATRVLCAAVATASVLALIATVPVIGGDRLALTSARGVWVATLGASYAAVLALACSIPWLPGRAAEQAGAL